MAGSDKTVQILIFLGWKTLHNHKKYTATINQSENSKLAFLAACYKFYKNPKFD